jgi:anti-anti-sigma factor
MSVKLIQVGDFVTREFPIEVDEFNIGRDYTCDLRLDHGRISRNHCRILRRGNRVLVEALYSTAGTAVNQKVLDPNRPPLEVHDGDHLWVGPEHFQFAIRTDSDDPDEGDEGRTALGPRVQRAAELPENPLLRDVPASQSRVAHQLLERLSTPARAEESTTHAEPTTVTEGNIDVMQMEGVTLVRLLPKALVAESDIRTISEELGELIDSGQSCITLHLGNVERMSSQVIGEVFQVYRRCKAKGGTLKVCRVSPQVASVFAMTNMQRHIEIFPDERMALKSLWPQQEPSQAQQAPLRPKPAADKVHPDERKAAPLAPPATATVPACPPKRVRLIVEVGRAKGQAVEIRGPRFLVGRDPQCQLRPNSNAISRLHTAIEQRDGRIFVRDLGSQNGTILNERVLRNEEAEAVHGDRLQIEVLHFTFAIEAQTPAEATAPGPRSGSLGALLGEPLTDPIADTTIMTIPEFAAASESPPTPHVPELPEAPSRTAHLLTCEVVGDVAVVTLRTPDLTEESIIGAVRVELESLLEDAGHNRMVLRFDRVKTLSKGAVVMFLARAQHLVRMNGALRFCNVSPSVLGFLEKTQLPLLIEIYPTIDEALLTSWGSERDSETTA